jgi:phage antirepressor YoqD-like protein
LTREQKDLAETIAKANGGQVQFGLCKAAKIAGKGRTEFAAWLHKRGVMVEKTGRHKMVNVNDLAVAMTMGRSTPL